MPLIRLDEIEKEYVTPKYSTAFGELVAGDRIEVGRLRFDADEGAVEHAHPQEQVMIIISGRLHVEIPSEGEEAELGPGEGFHARSNVKHKVTAVRTRSSSAARTSSTASATRSRRARRTSSRRW